ncbi:patatin-like phospholipase family protein [Fulvivirga lutimaris]|uniref:patatin-like phospholipase family protein n=1 Tax=Fulvivirga lutimaris TaxID=1819566 RepID=UPI0012BD51FB|nr:patatin-like phospholipase family protein [Fulvivirga lutimaris]MTI38343.1 patatin [Fulvivirga lutimaris]
MTAKSVGLTLSGGGARGIAHLGVIKAFEEHGVKFDVLSGASAGAIIGALYSYGYSVNEILKIILDLKAFKFIQPAMSTKGLLKMDVIRKFLESYLPENSFEKLKIPLFIAATNIRTGTTTYFESGDLIGIICASSCIPVLFQPVTLENELYIDGGILNNLPTEIIRDRCDILIGSHSNPVDKNFEVKNARFVLERALMLAITRNAIASSKLCDILVEPEGLEPFKVMDLNKAKEIFGLGYKTTTKLIEEQKLIEKIGI